jgi:hypothetical protein
MPSITQTITNFKTTYQLWTGSQNKSGTETYNVIITYYLLQLTGSYRWYAIA